jgi:ribonuclease HI
MNKVLVFVDGSCYYKTKLGGIGIYIIFKNFTKSIKIGYENTTISRMELKAIIVALKNIKSNLSFQYEIYSDSEYVVKSINEYMKNWILINFQGIKNVELWKEFLEERKRFDNFQIKFLHIRGHQKVYNLITKGNYLADKLANYKFQDVYLKNDLL